MAHHRGLLAAAVALGALPCLALAADRPAAATPSPGATLGFAIANFDMEMRLADGQACPQGPTLGQMEVFLRNLSGKERRFWSRPENVEQMHFVAGRAPGGEDLCQHPTLSVDPGMRMVEGSGPAPGLDLSGPAEAARGTCAQPRFTGADGGPVDNQLYRILGCATGFQRGQQYQSNYINEMQVGEHSYLIELKGVDDRRNDAEVDVGIYASPNELPLAGVSESDTLQAGVRLIPNASIDIDPDPRFQNHLKGRIVDGVLTTEPVDLVLPLKPAFRAKPDPAKANARPEEKPLPPTASLAEVARADQARAHDIMQAMESGNEPPKKVILTRAGKQPLYVLNGARLRAELTPDGRLTGLLAGYYDVQTFYENNALMASAAALGFHCSGLWYALQRLADGDRDPATGQCRSISTAFRVDAVPAFLVREDEAKAAEPVQQAAQLTAPEPRAPETGARGWLKRLGW